MSWGGLPPVAAILAALLGAPSPMLAAIPPGATETTEGLVMIILVAGLSGAAAVGLIALAVLTVGRQRGDEKDAAGLSRRAARVDRTEEILRRRRLRRARMRLPQDPIMAAMGIDDGPSAGPVELGPEPDAEIVSSGRATAARRAGES